MEWFDFRSVYTSLSGLRARGSKVENLVREDALLRQLEALRLRDRHLLSGSRFRASSCVFRVLGLGPSFFRFLCLCFVFCVLCFGVLCSVFAVCCLLFVVCCLVFGLWSLGYGG